MITMTENAVSTRNRFYYTWRHPKSWRHSLCSCSMEASSPNTDRHTDRHGSARLPWLHYSNIGDYWPTLSTGSRHEPMNTRPGKGQGRGPTSHQSQMKTTHQAWPQPRGPTTAANWSCNFYDSSSASQKDVWFWIFSVCLCEWSSACEPASCWSWRRIWGWPW